MIGPVITLVFSLYSLLDELQILSKNFKIVSASILGVVTILPGILSIFFLLKELIGTKHGKMKLLIHSYLRLVFNYQGYKFIIQKVLNYEYCDEFSGCLQQGNLNLIVFGPQKEGNSIDHLRAPCRTNFKMRHLILARAVLRFKFLLKNKNYVSDYKTSTEATIRDVSVKLIMCENKKSLKVIFKDKITKREKIEVFKEPQGGDRRGDFYFESSIQRRFDYLRFLLWNAKDNNAFLIYPKDGEDFKSLSFKEILYCSKKCVDYKNVTYVNCTVGGEVSLYCDLKGFKKEDCYKIEAHSYLYWGSRNLEFLKTAMKPFCVKRPEGTPNCKWKYYKSDLMRKYPNIFKWGEILKESEHYDVFNRNCKVEVENKDSTLSEIEASHFLIFNENERESFLKKSEEEVNNKNVEEDIPTEIDDSPIEEVRVVKEKIVKKVFKKEKLCESYKNFYNKVHKTFVSGPTSYMSVNHFFAESSYNEEEIEFLKERECWFEESYSFGNKRGHDFLVDIFRKDIRYFWENVQDEMELVKYFLNEPSKYDNIFENSSQVLERVEVHKYLKTGGCRMKNYLPRDLKYEEKNYHHLHCINEMIKTEKEWLAEEVSYINKEIKVLVEREKPKEIPVEVKTVKNSKNVKNDPLKLKIKKMDKFDLLNRCKVNSSNVVKERKCKRKKEKMNLKKTFNENENVVYNGFKYILKKSTREKNLKCIEKSLLFTCEKGKTLEKCIKILFYSLSLFMIFEMNNDKETKVEIDFKKIKRYLQYRINEVVPSRMILKIIKMILDHKYKLKMEGKRKREEVNLDHLDHDDFDYYDKFL